MSKITPCEFGDGKCLHCGVDYAQRGECEGFVYPEADPEKLAMRAEIDRLKAEAVAADIRIANDALVIAGLTAERDALARCKLADQDAYVAMRDQRDAARADALRYRWLCENGDADGGLFIGTGRNGTWGECGHSAYHHKEHADAAIDKAMRGEQP